MITRVEVSTRAVRGEADVMQRAGWWAGAGVLAAWLAVAASPASAQQAGFDLFQKLEAEGEARVIVAFDQDAVPGGPGVVKRAVLANIDPSEFRVTHTWRPLHAVAGVVTPSGLGKLLADPRVLRVDLDTGARISVAEGQSVIRARELHAHGYTGMGVKVAVIDTGVDTDHSDLSDDLVGEACFCENAAGGCCPNGSSVQIGVGAAEDDQGHGTNVAGIITGRGGRSPSGVAPDSRLVAVKVLGSDGSGSTAGILSGLLWVIESHPDTRVVNLSLGGGYHEDYCDLASAETIAYAAVLDTMRLMGMTVFAAAGNESYANAVGQPACIASAIAVGATYDGNVGTMPFSVCTDYATETDLVACFSNDSFMVDLLAPGCHSTAAGVGGGSSGMCGTSQATPHAAGAAALLFQVDPAASADDVEAVLELFGRSVADPYTGLVHPRIDLAAIFGM
jgi:subtilisin family serine protease